MRAMSIKQQIAWQKTPLEITGIGEIRDKTVEVTLKKTGKKCWLKKKLVEFHPGRVYVPQWLAHKILEKDARS